MNTYRIDNFAMSNHKKSFESVSCRNEEAYEQHIDLQITDEASSAQQPKDIINLTLQE